MTNLKELLAKYSDETITLEGGLGEDQEIDMNPDMSIIDVINNDATDGEIKEHFEAAVSDIEEYVGTTEDVEDLEETIDEEEKGEATAESAVRVIAKIEGFMTKHGFTTPEDREYMGVADVVTIESANNFPIASRESAIESGKALIEKIKKVLKMIVDKIIAAYKAIKQKLLAFLGNNQAVVKKLIAAANTLEDKTAEGKEIAASSVYGKFKLSGEKINTKDGLKAVLAAANSSDALVKISAEFVKGVASKNIESYNNFSIVKANDSLQTVFEASKVIPIRLYGNNVVALVSKKDGESNKVSVVTVDISKSVALPTGKPSVMGLSDIKTVLNDCNAYIGSQIQVVTKLDATFEGMKAIKLDETPEGIAFAKEAKIESNIGALTRSKLVYVESIGETIKNVLQILNANLSVKVKKGETPPAPAKEEK